MRAPAAHDQMPDAHDDGEKHVLGQRFQHYRRSNFIDGVGRDAAYVADHLAQRTAPIARP